MNADPEVMEFFPSVLPPSESDAFVDRIERHFEEHGYGLWAVESIGGFIGFVGLWAVPLSLPPAPSVEIGWRLTRSAWGRGYATEAALAVRDDAFDRLGFGELVSYTAAVNRRSRAVMERIGMAHDPRSDFDHPALEEGHALRPHVVYRSLRSQQPAASSQ
jgi:RimJ/RimL family protein N-acetyltransferase